MNVRAGDTVLVLTGKDRGKRGRIERVQRTKRGMGVVVTGVNVAKKHERPRGRTRQGGIIDLPVPLHVSNVQLVCPNCNKPTRVAHGHLPGESGRRVRMCKQCGEQIEVGRR
ncbi:MAG: 50S ribosomal protein L24 [Candidatus Limnocylindria bacterium]